jgi:hypothetical protein
LSNSVINLSCEKFPKAEKVILCYSKQKKLFQASYSGKSYMPSPAGHYQLYLIIQIREKADGSPDTNFPAVEATVWIKKASSLSETSLYSISSSVIAI